MASTQTNQMLAAAASACEDKKAEDIRILALDPAESGLTDYFLICNGTNDRQNVAIADEVELRLKREFGTYANSVEGRRQAEWILLDYVDFIVHVFSPEKRAFYGLERLRKSATSLSVDELNSEIKQQIEAGRRGRKTAASPVPGASAKRPAPAVTAKSPAKKKAVKVAAAKKTAVKKTAPVKRSKAAAKGSRVRKET
ncbi:MAG TPA: ribosome silencing factor [Acidobacteriaceae bacterium]|jgi:ribosome-associated protein|nr:ribosome silencing factor [Acidobacteriaceae bacterium]